MLLYSIIISELVAIFFLYRIWRAQDYLVFKIALSFVVLIPFIGPVFYLIGSDNTPLSRSNLNAGGRLFGRGRYTEWWDSEKPRMVEKIKALEEKTDERKKHQ